VTCVKVEMLFCIALSCNWEGWVLLGLEMEVKGGHQSELLLI